MSETLELRFLTLFVVPALAGKNIPTKVGTTNRYPSQEGIFSRREY